MKVRPSEPKGREKVIPLTYDAFVLHVIMPDDLAAVAPNALKPKVTHLVNIALSTPFRDFPFYIRAKDQVPGPKGSLELFDIPTTLLASREAIDLILKDSSLVLL